MPFKTRKQKENAASRNYGLNLEANTFSYGEEKVETIKKKSRKNDFVERDNYSYLYGDILRIAALTFVILAIQIVLRLYFGDDPASQLLRIFS